MDRTLPDLAVGGVGGGGDGGGFAVAAAVMACDVGGSGGPSARTPRRSRSCRLALRWLNCLT